MKTRVLVADDQPAIRDSLQLLLKPNGFEVETAGTPEEALEAVRTGRFDLLIMDLNYARGSTSGEEGLDLLGRVQTMDRTLPVVVMTAWSSVEVAVEAMRGRLRDFVQKPWDNDRMLQIVHEQLARGRSVRAEARELGEALEIQRRLLPTSIPTLAGYTIATAWEPAHTVGGDYFDILELGAGRAAFCIGDVVGKGLPAALLMSNVQSAVRVFASEKTDPADVCENLNRIIGGNIAVNKFISFFYGVLDVETGRFVWVNAGHNAPVVARSGGAIEEWTASGTALGIGDALTTYASTADELGHGDRVLLFTDGLTEAENAAGEAFGTARLRELLSEHRALPGRELLDRVLAELGSFAVTPLADDVTAVLIARD